MPTVTTLLIGLGQNIALMLSLTLLYSMLIHYLEAHFARFRGVVVGILFGAAAAIAMNLQIQVAPGVSIDSRVVVVALAGTFGGMPAALIAGTVTALVRWSIGGIGAPPGIAAIVTGAVLGLLLYRYLQRRKQPLQPWHVFALGLALAIQGLLWTFLLPIDIAMNAFRAFAIPVLIAYPAGALLLGTLFSYELRRRETELRLRDSEAKNQTLLNALPYVLLLIDEKGNLQQVFDRDRVLASHDNVPDAILPILATSSFGTPSPTVKQIQLTIRGKKRDFEVRNLYLTPHERLIILHDMTESKKHAQQQLQLTLEQERVQMLEEFISHASHHLKTPLTIVQTKLHLIRSTNDTTRQQTHLAGIEKQAAMMDRLINELLEMARLDAPAMNKQEVVNINSVIHTCLDSLNEFADEQKVIVQTQFASDLPGVIGDPKELYRAFLNIIENAIQYTSEGGSVTVVTETDAESVVITVQDTGIGIPPETLAHIFDRFYRAPGAMSVRPEGTGVGLAIVKKTIDRHRGQIAVDSQEHAGTIFRITLPLHVTVP